MSFATGHDETDFVGDNKKINSMLKQCVGEIAIQTGIVIPLSKFKGFLDTKSTELANFHCDLLDYPLRELKETYYITKVSGSENAFSMILIDTDDQTYQCEFTFKRVKGEAIVDVYKSEEITRYETADGEILLREYYCDGKSEFSIIEAREL